MGNFFQKISNIVHNVVMSDAVYAGALLVLGYYIGKDTGLMLDLDLATAGALVALAISRDVEKS